MMIAQILVAFSEKLNFNVVEFPGAGLGRLRNIHSELNGVGFDRTGHMSFLTGQDRTPKFAGQVLPDRTESGLIFLDILPYK